MKKTKIICTMGPACADHDTLTRMVQAGMNVARFNFSHGSHDDHRANIDLVKQVRRELDVPVALMLDTKGPEFRIGTFETGSVELAAGDAFTLTTQQVPGNQERVSVSCPGIVERLAVGDRILINDGLVVVEVTRLTDTDAVCRVLVGGRLSNNKSMSFPNKVLHTTYLSEQDKGRPALRHRDGCGLRGRLLCLHRPGYAGPAGVSGRQRRQGYRHHCQD